MNLPHLFFCDFVILWEIFDFDPSQDGLLRKFSVDINQINPNYSNCQ